MTPRTIRGLVMEWETVRREDLSFSEENRQKILVELRKKLDSILPGLELEVTEQQRENVLNFVLSLLDPDTHNHVQELHLMSPDSKLMFHELMKSL